jgi:transposase InsO family protein
LKLLTKDKWSIKLSKCRFAQQQISYLGHIISANGVATDPAKVEAITSWPQPKNVKELRSFLGLAGYYKKFVRHFAVISKPLTTLLKKNELFVWTSEHTEAFVTLKTALVSALVLSMPDFSVPFCIEIDASNQGVGAVLLQKGHPLAFISKPLGPRTKGLSTYEKEYLAILIAIDQWRQYLQQAEFIIHTDQKSLIFLNEQRLNTPWQQKVFVKLLGLQYKLVYKKGVDNSVADALSRRAHAPAHLCALSTVTPKWLSEVVHSNNSDPKAQELITQLTIDPKAIPGFTFHNGILRYKNKVWVGPSVELQSKIVQALHSSPLGGHSGIPVTVRRIKQYFVWPGLKKLVHQLVSACTVCQQAKPERVKYPGLLQPLPIPDGAWQVVSLDFVEGFPLSKNKNAVLVVVDKFSKYSHFIALSHPFTALSVDQLYMTYVYKLHGMPLALISDRDRIFTSALWQALFKLAGVQLQMSSAYHPQTDGKTERVNQCMETFLRCFVNASPKQWSQWIHLAEYWYNTSWHSALQSSPFQVLYGHSPRSFGLESADACPISILDDWLQER